MKEKLGNNLRSIRVSFRTIRVQTVERIKRIIVHKKKEQRK